ncbi:hypothetical protein [Brachyspira sp.]
MNSSDYQYRTPLMYAVSNGNADIILYIFDFVLHH